MTAGSFVERHGLRTDDEARRAGEIAREAEGLRLVRVAWADPHGASRAKALSVPAFRAALADGYDVNVATSTLDGSGGRVFASFEPGGGMGLDEMTGSPSLVAVPDPGTFRVLPWADGVGWILCDEYFRDGRPFHFSSRRLLRRQVARLRETGLVHVVGLEIEWYLARLAQDLLTAENTGVPGRRGAPVATAPAEPGYSYHSETALDLMQPVLGAVADACEGLGLGLRSMENEYGPGQVETTFAPADALRAADDFVLFRTAARQVCRRLGHFATFMCRPALAGHFASGWHLHQSLAGADDGRNRFAPAEGEILSETGRRFLAGLLEHAVPGAVLAAPTVTGLRRFRPGALAPDRATWAPDHRGAMLRVISAPGDPASRIENRAGEPGANPYLFVASQIAAGIDGIERGLVPQPPDRAPYEADRPRLPGALGDALAALEGSGMFRRAFGDLFVDYYLRLKRAELDRFRRDCAEAGVDEDGPDVTDWEQREYYDFF